jgi:hypothetical protein
MHRIEEAIRSLSSRYFDDRERGIERLNTLARESKVAVGEKLVPLLQNPDPRLRLLGIRLIGEIAYKPALPRIAALIPELDAAGPWERATLIEAFEKFGPEAEKHVLERNLDANPLGRIILGRIALGDVLKFIKDFLDEENSSGWFEGQFDPLKPRGKSVVYALMIIVETYFSPEDLSFFEASSAEADQIRWLAIHGLGEIRDPVAVPLLKSLIRDIESFTTERSGDELDPSQVEKFVRFVTRNAAVACWKCGDREPLVDRVRRIREEISSINRPVRSSFEMDKLGDLFWDLAITLSPFGLVDEVVEAYQKNIHWKRRGNTPAREYAVAQYNIACAWSKAGMAEKGLDALYEAFRMGYTDLDWIEVDGDLDAVRALPEYRLAIAYASIAKLAESGGSRDTRRKLVNQALMDIGAAVSRGITDPTWFKRDRFAAVSHEPGFHWHLARFHALAGRAPECASRLRRCLEQDRPPERIRPDWELAFDLEALSESPDFEKVRGHAAIRALLSEQGGK